MQEAVLENASGNLSRCQGKRKTLRFLLEIQLAMEIMHCSIEWKFAKMNSGFLFFRDLFSIAPLFSTDFFSSLSTDAQRRGAIPPLVCPTAPNVEREKSVTTLHDNDRQTEIRLHESIAMLKAELAYVQHRNRLMLDMSSDLVFILGDNGKFVFVNKAAAEMAGLEADAAGGKTFSDIFPRDVAQHLAKRVKQVFSKAEPMVDSPPFLLPPRQLWVETYLMPMQRSDGKVESVFVTIRDITERKLVETALKESEERFRQIVQQMPNPVLVMAPDGTIVMVNIAFLELMKVPPTEFLAGRINVLANPAVAYTGVLDELRKAFNGAVVFFPELHVPLSQLLNKPSGEKIGDICVDATVFPVYLRPGDVFQVVAIFKDITESKRAEQALRESDKRARVQYKSFPIPTYTWQRVHDDFVFVDYNDAASQFTSGGVSRVLGKKLSEVFSGQPFVMEDMMKCLTERTVVRKESSFRFPMSGVEKHLTLTYVFVEPDAVMVHTEDTTDKEKMDAEIRKAEHLESLGILAGGIAHDFNNLLAGIFGYIGLAREIGKNDEKIRECLDKAMTVFRQAKSLTQQLLTFSKGGSPVRKLASISDLLRDLSSFALSGTNVKAEVLIPDDLWSCEVDSGQLSEVIHNCVINAQQSMPDGGVISVGAQNVTIDEQSALPLAPGPHVRIYIQDKGVGIPRHLLARVLDPFFTTKRTGSGLGLTIAYSIMKKHRGHLEIQSEVGVGTLVNMYVPASADDPPAQENTAVAHGNGRVLLMDDEVFVLDAMSGIIRSLGYSVETAPNGADAVAIFSKAKENGNPFDAVILDLTIPGGFGGKQVLARMRDVNPGVKAIATSGYSDDPVMSEPWEFGFKAALRKPYTIEELSRILQSVTKEK